MGARTERMQWAGDGWRCWASERVGPTVLTLPSVLVLRSWLSSSHCSHPSAMRTAIGIAALVLLIAVASVAGVEARSHYHREAAAIACGVGSLDFSELSSLQISGTDWAALNFYWHPCGALGPLAPTLCTPATNPSFATSSMCIVNKFAFTSASLGDWSLQGQPTWSILESTQTQAQTHKAKKHSKAIRSITQSRTAAAAATGAVLSFSSSLANCTASAGASPSFYSTSITFLCDSAGLYPLHGPLDLDLDNAGPCAWGFSMRTILACSPAQRQAIAQTRDEKNRLQQQQEQDQNVLLR